MLFVAMAALFAGVGDPRATVLLDEFKQQCIDQPSFDAIRRAAPDRGWEAYEPVKGSAVFRAIEAGKKLLGSIDVEPSVLVYRRELGGRQIEMVVFSVHAPFNGRLTPLTNCNIYDFAAAEGPSTDSLRDWAGRDPEVKQIGSGAFIAEWAPGLAARLPSQTRVGFVPNSKEFAGQPVRGLVLISDVFEKSK